MKQWRYLVLALTLSSSSVLANSMKSNFDEGRAYGGTANGNAQNVMKEFSSEQIMPNAGSPEQVKLYTGQNSNPNLGAMGIQALSNTEVGQVLTQSSINNPADTISTESDMLKRSDEIVNNAHYLTGGISGKQCIKQSLSKSHFTNHFCEKDQAVNAICKITDEVKWKTKNEYIEKELTITGLKLQDIKMLVDGSPPRYECESYNDNDYCQSWYYGYGSTANVTGKLSIEIPERGKLVGYKVDIKGYDWFLKVRKYGNYTKLNTNLLEDITNIGIVSRSLSHNVNQGDKLKIGFNMEVKYPIARELHEDSFLYRYATFDVLLIIAQEKEIAEAYTEKSLSCNSPIDFKKVIKIGDQCTQEGGSRNFTKDGQTVTLNSDCWEKTETYLVNDASDNECKRYDNDRNCTVGERECLSSENGLCTRFRLKYQCQHTTKTEGVVCGDKFFCSDGSCADLNGSVNADFGHAVSQLASLAQAGKDISLDAQNLRAFSGRPMACRKSGFGFSDCCKDSGWGHKAGIAHCNSEENVLGKAKEKNTVIYVGTYCSKKVLRHCVQRKSAYCVFDSKLARIIQYQGRSGQLGVGFGGAQNPDCRGLTVDELQRLNFNAMDYSDFYSELQENTKIPNQDKIVDFIQKNIAGQLQQK